MSEILVAPTEIEEYDDVDQVLDEAVEDADEVDVEYRVPFPPEYVAGIIGHRGGGKSALLAYYLLNCLYWGDTVFTNLTLYPEKLGIDNKPFPLDLDHLLNFDQALQRAVLGIEEIGMWYERKRGMSTTSIIQEKFWQLMIRKQNLRIFYTNQSPRLPGALAEQTDVVLQGYDLFFCDWARENSTNLAKGQTFLYTVLDRTGIFGQFNRMWQIRLRHAHKLWPVFDTYQRQDPYSWAKKTIIKGGEQVIDMDTGESYAMSEEGIRAWQHDVTAFSIALTKLIGSYQSAGFMDMAERHEALTDLPDRYVFSVHQLRKGLTNLKGTKRKQAEGAYNELLALANQGQLARFGPRHESIELAKPVTVDQQEAQYE